MDKEKHDFRTKSIGNPSRINWTYWNFIFPCLSVRKRNEQMKVHKVIRDEWSENPDESEYILCDPDDRLVDPKCSLNWNYITCKRCLKKRVKK